MIVHDGSDNDTGARRVLSVVTTPPDPTFAEWRARCLLALAVVNHRRSSAGLATEDVDALTAALRGEWDEVA